MKYKSSAIETVQWTLECDLTNETEKLIYNLLKLKGYSEDALSTTDLLLLYCKDLMLSIPPFPRNVKFSKQFECPSEYKKALEEFVQKVKNGEDLTPFMSERVRKNLDGNDMLLSDWGIYHFHLTRRFRQDGTARRSEYQIFACCDNESMYFIQIYRHDKKCLYSQEDLLRIVKENWPDLLSKYQLNEINPSNEKVNSEEREQLRNAHIMTMTVINKNVYFSPGGGYASDGSSVVAVRYRNKMFGFIRLLESKFKNNMSKFLDCIKKVKGTLVNKNLKLTAVSIDRNNLILFEINNGLIFVCPLMEEEIILSPIDHIPIFYEKPDHWIVPKISICEVLENRFGKNASEIYL